MADPSASRPYMPGYGMLPQGEGGGLLPWSWAQERLRSSRNYWLVSSWPDGRPHSMPVWGVWHEERFWFSSSRGSRKSKNLSQDPRCVVSTEDTQSPVVVEGRAELVTAQAALEMLLRLENEKYGTAYGMETLDPELNSAFSVRPLWVFGLSTADFQGSPTRWSFESSP